MACTGKSTDDLEIEMLNGQKMQIPQCAKKDACLVEERYGDGFPAVHSCSYITKE